jgi:hypothetical protein
MAAEYSVDPLNQYMAKKQALNISGHISKSDTAKIDYGIARLGPADR